MLDLKSNNCVLKCIDFEKLDKNIEIKENVSPVYNFHISRIIEHINEIHDIDVDDNI